MRGVFCGQGKVCVSPAIGPALGYVTHNTQGNWNVLEESLRDLEGIYLMRFCDNALRRFGVTFGHFETGA